MKQKWVPITENYELTKMAIVTRITKDPDGRPVPGVTIGYPGWGLQNKTTAYMPLPKNIIEAPELWKSEYRGDEPPRSGDYIVQLQGREPHNKNKLEIRWSYFHAKACKWLMVPRDSEVIGWMECPKPYEEVAGDGTSAGCP